MGVSWGNIHSLCSVEWWNVTSLVLEALNVNIQTQHPPPHWDVRLSWQLQCMTQEGQDFWVARSIFQLWIVESLPMERSTMQLKNNWESHLGEESSKCLKLYQLICTIETPQKSVAKVFSLFLRLHHSL